jgi:anti-sigma regulatory factor (Ser/Thr protein kinase)
MTGSEPAERLGRYEPAVPLELDVLRRVPAVAQQVAGMRDAVLSSAGARGVIEAGLTDIALAVSEACSNVVLHAYLDAAAPGSLTVAAGHRDGQFVVAVRDEGRGMLPRADSPGLGLGLSIIGRLTERLEISDNGGCGTEVRMTFPVASEWS